jgi:hypothetical protein
MACCARAASGHAAAQAEPGGTFEAVAQHPPIAPPFAPAFLITAGLIAPWWTPGDLGLSKLR